MVNTHTNTEVKPKALPLTYPTNIPYTYLFASINFRELLEMYSGKNLADFYFHGSGRSNLQFFYLVHILCSCTRQYECDDVLDGFWGPGDGCRLDHGRMQVAKQCQDKFLRVLIFTVHAGFIREYSENLYTVKISTYTVVQSPTATCCCG